MSNVAKSYVFSELIFLAIALKDQNETNCKENLRHFYNCVTCAFMERLVDYKYDLLELQNIL